MKTNKIGIKKAESGILKSIYTLACEGEYLKTCRLKCSQSRIEKLRQFMQHYHNIYSIFEKRSSSYMPLQDEQMR
jgi:hypothetical protein